MRFLFFVAFIIFSEFLSGQINTLIKSGPMLGPITYKDATIWVQTKESATLHIEYHEVGHSSIYKSEEFSTKSKHRYTASVHLFPLKDDTEYEYRIYNGQTIVSPIHKFKTPKYWRFRTDAPDFQFLTGSCLYINDSIQDRPGKPYGGEYEILKSMAKEQGDFMLWLGDNTYLREGDFESRNGIYYRQSHTRNLPELQPFLAKMPHYAIWDDHDYGPNDSDWTYPLKKYSLQAFKDFWPNEAYGAGQTEGVTSGFIWNDCVFYCLDDRWYRTVDKDGTILGDQQKYWLEEALLSSPAAIKFVAVGGQFLSDLADFENFANYAEERQEIIDFIIANKIKNVIFLTGDRHHSEISKYEDTDSGITIYDITASAITSTTYDHSNEKNTLRVNGSMFGVRNYTVIHVEGTSDQRHVNVSFKDKNGNVLYNYKINVLK